MNSFSVIMSNSLRHAGNYHLLAQMSTYRHWTDMGVMSLMETCMFLQVHHA